MDPLHPEAAPRCIALRREDLEYFVEHWAGRYSDWMAKSYTHRSQAPGTMFNLGVGVCMHSILTHSVVLQVLITFCTDLRVVVVHLNDGSSDLPFDRS